jgi:predicted transposase YdaD
MTGPHDRFFRYLFNHPARAEALLRHNLPASLVAEVDWSSLRRESGTLADWDRETRKDLLFSARCRHAVREAPPHFFLVEHQSSVDPWMALRLHDYAWRLIQHWRALHPRSRLIPEVTSLVVYPRQDRGWSAALRLEDYYPVRVMAEGEKPRRCCAPRSEYLLAAIQSEQAARAYAGPALVPLGLLVLSFAGTRQMASRLPHWSDLFAQVHATDGPQTLYRVVRYVHHLGDKAAVASLRHVLHSIMESTRAETFMRTMAEELREQGHRQGLAEGEARGEARGVAKGVAKGLARALLRLLDSKGIHVDDIARQRIQSCMDVATLERWLDRALSSSQLSEVLDGPAQ